MTKNLTPDELEDLAWQYGGTVERNDQTGELLLRVKIKGSPVTLRSHLPISTKAAS